MAKWQTQPTQNRQGLSVAGPIFTLSGAILFSSWVPFLLFVVQCAVVQIIAQLAGAGWVSELAQRLRLNLANALAREIELLANFLQSVPTAPKAKA